MPTFEQRMRAIDVADANRNIKDSGILALFDLAREVDAALADQAYRLEVQQKTLESTYAALQRKYNEIGRLTALNTAKGELIEFYEKYIGSIAGLILTHPHLAVAEETKAEGERLRARIRSLENES